MKLSERSFQKKRILDDENEFCSTDVLKQVLECKVYVAYVHIFFR